MYGRKRSYSQSNSGPNYPGTPVRKYGPTRADFKKPQPFVTKAQLYKAIAKTEELKYWDTTSSGGGPENSTSSGTLKDLTLISQGTTSATRVGDKIMGKRLRIRGEVTSSGLNNVVRIIVFRWMVDDTADAPQMNEILEPAQVGTALSPYAPYNSSLRNRFQILYDKNIAVQATVGTLSKLVKIDLKLAKQQVNYQYGANTGQYHYYLAHISDDSVTSYPTIIWNCRLYFTDS